MIRPLYLLALAPACAPDAPLPTCEEQACAHVAECSPVVTGGVDWRTPEACLSSGWTCADPGACLEAVAALPCLSSPPTWDEIVANTRALVAVRVSCLGATR